MSLPGLLSSAPPIGITGPWQICRVGAEATGADRLLAITHVSLLVIGHVAP